MFLRVDPGEYASHPDPPELQGDLEALPLIHLTRPQHPIYPDLFVHDLHYPPLLLDEIMFEEIGVHVQRGLDQDPHPLLQLLNSLPRVLLLPQPPAPAFFRVQIELALFGDWADQVGLVVDNVRELVPLRLQEGDEALRLRLVLESR